MQHAHLQLKQLPHWHWKEPWRQKLNRILVDGCRPDIELVPESKKKRRILIPVPRFTMQRKYTPISK